MKWLLSDFFFSEKCFTLTIRSEVSPYIYLISQYEHFVSPQTVWETPATRSLSQISCGSFREHNLPVRKKKKSVSFMCWRTQTTSWKELMFTADPFGNHYNHRGLMRAETTLGESYQLEVLLSQRRGGGDGGVANRQWGHSETTAADGFYASTHWIYKLTCKER